MYHRSGTAGSCWKMLFSLTRWQHLSVWNDIMTTILKVWCQIKDRTVSINAHLLEEYSCHISSRSDLKWRNFRFFTDTRPNNNNNKMSSDLRSVPELKKLLLIQIQMCIYTRPVSVFCGTCFVTLTELTVVTALVAGGRFGKYFDNAGSILSAGMLTGSW